MLARDIMKTGVLSVSSQATVKEALEIMAKKNVSGLPVLNENGDIKGIISESDIIYPQEIFNRLDHWILLESFLHRNSAAQSLDNNDYGDDTGYHLDDKVEEVMSTKVITARPDTPVADIARLMVNRKINRIPIVKGKKVVGIITRGDILQAIRLL